MFLNYNKAFGFGISNSYEMVQQTHFVLTSIVFACGCPNKLEGFKIR